MDHSYFGCCPHCLGLASIRAIGHGGDLEYCETDGFLKQDSTIWLKPGCCNLDFLDFWTREQLDPVMDGSGVVGFRCNRCGQIQDHLISQKYMSPCCYAPLVYRNGGAQRSLTCQICGADCRTEPIPYVEARRRLSEAGRLLPLAPRTLVRILWPAGTPLPLLGEWYAYILGPAGPASYHVRIPGRPDMVLPDAQLVEVRDLQRHIDPTTLASLAYKEARFEFRHHLTLVQMVRRWTSAQRRREYREARTRLQDAAGSLLRTGSRLYADQVRQEMADLERSFPARAWLVIRGMTMLGYLLLRYGRRRRT